MKETKPYRFIITGGGTGGHIYPALAVANKIKERFPDAEILFVGAEGKMEMQKVPEAGYKIVGLEIRGLQRKLTFKNLMVPLKAVKSFLSAMKIVKEFKPDAVVGFGGYASAPVMMAASRMKVPAMIQEQNSYAGMTNKFLAKKVEKICVAYEGMENYFPKQKIVITGNPVRKDILDTESKKQAGIAAFGLSPDKRTILVLGGSLGARTVNNCIIEGVEKIAGNEELQMVWQTGKFYFEEMKSKLSKYNQDNIEVREFLKEMDQAYAVADIVVSRAGALTVSELSLAAKPVIFVPSPNVAEDHQTKNAMALVNKEAAVMVKDVEASDKLIDVAMELAMDGNRQTTLKKNIAQLAMPNATEDIVKELFNLIQCN